VGRASLYAMIRLLRGIPESWARRAVWVGDKTVEVEKAFRVLRSFIVRGSL
jgi:hypothetical protein